MEPQPRHKSSRKLFCGWISPAAAPQMVPILVIYSILYYVVWRLLWRHDGGQRRLQCMCRKWQFCSVCNTNIDPISSEYRASIAGTNMVLTRFHSTLLYHLTFWAAVLERSWEFALRSFFSWLVIEFSLHSMRQQFQLYWQPYNSNTLSIHHLNKNQSHYTDITQYW